MTVRKDTETGYSMKTLARQGKTPITFNGRHYAWAETERDSSRAGDLYNFHRINVYECDNGSAVVSVRFFTNWGKDRRGELPYDHAEFVPSLGHVAEALIRHDPCQGLIGVPPGITHWEQRNAFNQKTVQMRYQEKVGELLAMAPELCEHQPDGANSANDREALSNLLNKMAGSGKVQVILSSYQDSDVPVKEDLDVREIYWANDTLKIEVS